MMIQIPGVLNAAQLEYAQQQLAEADWLDGRISAGHTTVQIKHNLQVSEQSASARRVGDMILDALRGHPLFISAVLPHTLYPPMFNRYESGMTYGPHFDNAIRIHPASGQILRTDVSATLFLTAPEAYDGGELRVDDTFGQHRVKLAAGDMVIYPASSLHQVSPVTRGSRMAAFFWIQSLIRDDQQRSLLFGMDQAIQKLTRQGADAAALVQLTGAYHNLVRQWSET